MQEPKGDGVGCTWIMRPREGSETPQIVKATHLKDVFGFWSASLLIKKLVKISHDLPLLWSMD